MASTMLENLNSKILGMILKSGILNGNIILLVIKKVPRLSDFYFINLLQLLNSCDRFFSNKLNDVK
jgi:hypothetical protein